MDQGTKKENEEKRGANDHLVVWSGLEAVVGAHVVSGSTGMYPWYFLGTLP